MTKEWGCEEPVNKIATGLHSLFFTLSCFSLDSANYRNLTNLELDGTAAPAFDTYREDAGNGNFYVYLVLRDARLL